MAETVHSAAALGVGAGGGEDSLAAPKAPSHMERGCPPTGPRLAQVK